ncbi:VOC family protein [Phenylobacterium sp. SCN 70-31]|mgnify:CR=1 FL=1|uniref:VOC family protein n=1 Tax=Phenylobacterium sp. SCN 70-31 TaxID=1660129 RepID=UPI000B307508|nr:VOC family protein [Phenylobacterium sp. SCN 70-31]
MSDEPMQYCGVNHVALVCRDMAETVDFYQNVLEMPLVKTLDLPGGRGQHFFFDCGEGATVAFFWFPNAPAAAPGVASMHPDYRTVGSQTAHASMNHLAISVPLEKFDEYARRLRAKGVELRVLNHEDTEAHGNDKVTEQTWIRSMYFRDPNGIHMELAALTRAWRPDDVKHDPVDAEGRKTPVPRRAMA